MHIPAVLQHRKLCEEVSFSGAVVLTRGGSLTLRLTANGGEKERVVFNIVQNPSEPPESSESLIHVIIAVMHLDVLFLKTLNILIFMSVVPR